MQNRYIVTIMLAGAIAIGSAAAAQQQQTQQQVITGSDGPEITVVRKLTPSRDRLMRTVYIGDLNLKSADDRQMMEKRVAKAVQDMCAIPSPIPGQERGMTKPCRDEAWASARPQMEGAVQRAVGT